MTFEECIRVILYHEGGYVDNPHDPGSETKFGISKRSYPNLDISKLTEEKAKKIYREDYWEEMGLDFVPDELRLMLLDCSVNQGVDRARRILQASLAVTVDGIIGPITIKALNEADPMDLLKKIAIKRHHEYARLSTWDKFGKGWSRRLLDITIKSFSKEAI